MPRFNKKGPEGKGPRTGRGQGDCPPKNKVSRESLPRRLGRRVLGRTGK